MSELEEKTKHVAMTGEAFREHVGGV